MALHGRAWRSPDRGRTPARLLRLEPSEFNNLGLDNDDIDDIYIQHVYNDGRRDAMPLCAPYQYLRIRHTMPTPSTPVHTVHPVNRTTLHRTALNDKDHTRVIDKRHALPYAICPMPYAPCFLTYDIWPTS